MPNSNNSLPRKRKQPSSPSQQQAPRPSPYTPTHQNDQYQSQRNNSGGRGRARRQNSHSGPSSQQQQQQQPPHQQFQRTPSRLSNSAETAPAPTPTPAPAPAPTSASAPPTPAPPTPVPASVPPAEEPEDIRIGSSPAPPATIKEYWEYVTDNALTGDKWSPEGYQTVKDAVLEGAETKDELEISIIFQEIIKAALDERLHVSEASRILTDVIDSVPDVDLRQILIQSVYVFEIPDPLPAGKTVSAPPKLVELLNSLHPHPFSAEMLAAQLDSSTLISLGFVSSMFPKKAVRVTTAMVYKQRKHNLLREETEGFSKLITEFFTASYSQSPLEVVGRTGERVKGLIGAFELDPGRVLDILLDTAACTVVSNARFFVRLLKSSAWWPKQLPSSLDDEASSKGRDEVRAEKEKEKERADREFFAKLREEGIGAFFEEKGRGGNKVAAQLLGFKFRHYQQRDVTEVTPENLMVLSALLIKIGFIDLADLYPHLAPREEEGMSEVLDSWKKKIEEKQRGGKLNALMMAGALADDTAPPSRSSKSNNSEEKKHEERKKEEEARPKKDDNQKIVLLKYLLALGALPEGLFILGKYPWLPGPTEDVAEHLSRVLSQSIEPVYAPLVPETHSLGNKRLAVSQTGKAGLELHDQPRRKPMVTFTVSNLKLKTGDVEYRFFWDEWKDSVPVCFDARDIVVLMNTLGRFLGVRVGRDAVLMTKICRIGLQVLKSPDCEELDRDSWLKLTRAILVPAISLTNGNQGVVNELWKLLACFPTEQRYSFYGEWTSVVNKRIPELKAKVAETERETRDLMKRMSKTNVKLMARKLSKIATSNPITVMQVVLGQLESYDNIIDCVVDAAKYFTPLGFDAVGYCLLNSMSMEGRMRVQRDGMLTSKWLQALAQFCGKIYTRYHTLMDPAPLLEYVARQLKRNQSVELIVLQELMQSMAGINPEVNLNDTQLQGLAGGEMLQRQVLKAFRDRKAEDNLETMKTLTDTLLRTNLVPVLLVLIAQERQNCIFRFDDDDAPLKVVGTLFDDIHVVLSQYLDLLKMGLTPEQFEQVVPSVGRLCTEYAIDPDVAWWVSRPVIRHKMKNLEIPDIEDVEMKDDGAPDAPKSPWNPVLERIMDEVKPMLPEEVWTKLSVSFYVTFWQLSIYDIFVPMEAYQAETNRVNAAVRALDLDRSDTSQAGQQRKREKRDLLMVTHGQISAELKHHIRDHTKAIRRLAAEKEHWFGVNDNQRDVTDTFINYCILPRLMLSPNDASFCSRFIREVHKMGTPRFHTIGVYDAIFGKNLTSMIFQCTQREAENYGRFLKDIFADLHSWHVDRAVYEREAHGKNLVGFNVKGSPFDWEDFRKIFYKWHKTLHTAVKECLSSKEYMQIRNAIIILKHVAEYFPTVDWIGRTVVEKVEELVKAEKREDLKIAAVTLLGLLKKREKAWIPVNAFQKSEALTPGMPRPSPTPTPAPPSQTENENASQQAGQQRPPSNVTREYRPSTGSAPTSTPSTPQPSTAPVSAVSTKLEAEKEDGEIEDPRNRRPASTLPPRPPQPILEHRKPHPSRDQPRHQPHSQQPHSASQSISDANRPSSRAPTPRRDDPKLNNDSRRLDRPEIVRMPSTSSNRIQPPTIHAPHPQHQLPDRPDILRQLTLERRDAPMNIDRRDMRDSPREPTSRALDSRNPRPSDTRLPEKPLERRHSPRHNSRDFRDRHDQDRRGRETDFQRPPVPPIRDERTPRKEERIPESPQMDMPPVRPPPSGSRGPPQMLENDRNRRDDRDKDRGRDRRDRHEQHMNMNPQAGRLNDYPAPMGGPVDQPDHRMPDRKPDPLPQRHLPEPVRHPQEDAPVRVPAGPRADFERNERRGHQQMPKDRELFANQGMNAMRAPPGPPHPAEQFRDNRPPPSHFPQQESNHGRLVPPDPPIPKGPRDRGFPMGPRGAMNIRGASSAAQQQQQVPPPAGRGLPSPVDMKVPMPPTPERFSQSAPTTPTVDTSGIHPDRLKAFTQQPDYRMQASHGPPSGGPSPITSQPPPLGPRAGPGADRGPPSGRLDSPAVSSVAQPQHQPSPPTGPARGGGDREEQRNQRRHLGNVQNILTQQGDSPGAMGREIRGRARRGNGGQGPMQNQSNPNSPMNRDPRDLMAPQNMLPHSGGGRNSMGGGNGPLQQQQQPQQSQLPNFPQDRRQSNVDSRRTSLATPTSVMDRSPLDDPRNVDRSMEQQGGRSSRHHRSDRSERDRGDRDRERDRDRHMDRERERDREREFSDGRGSRKSGSDRGDSRGAGGSGKERERGDRGDRERDRDRRVEDDRERGRDRDRSGREERRPEERGSRGDRERKHGRGEDKGRDEVKRRRRGEWQG